MDDGADSDRTRGLVEELRRVLASVTYVDARPGRDAPPSGTGWNLYWPAGAAEPNVHLRAETRYRLISVAVVDDLVTVAFSWTGLDDEPTPFLALANVDPTSPAAPHGCLERLRQLFSSPEWPCAGSLRIGRWRVIRLDA